MNQTEIYYMRKFVDLSGCVLTCGNYKGRLEEEYRRDQGTYVPKTDGECMLDLQPGYNRERNAPPGKHKHPAGHRVHYPHDHLPTQYRDARVVWGESGIDPRAFNRPPREAEPWAFVLDGNDEMLGLPKKPLYREGCSEPAYLHHSSFTGGKKVKTAGQFFVYGRTAYLGPVSGHYSPDPDDFAHKMECWVRGQRTRYKFEVVRDWEKWEKVQEAAAQRAARRR